MTNFKLTIAYDGTNFEGFQTQNRPGSRTVQDVLNQKLNQMFQTDNDSIAIIGASRTDAGVHAHGQVANVIIDHSISEDGLYMGLNSVLPPDLKIVDVQSVDDNFHARFSARSKHYLYRVNTEKFADPITINYTGHYPWSVDIKDMQTAAKDLIGEHDFASFAAAGNQTQSTVRNISKIQIMQNLSAKEIELEFYGDSFLYKQIRIMVGTLLEIGSHRRPIDQIPSIIEAKNRDLVRYTAPASGLYLEEIFYE